MIRLTLICLLLAFLSQTAFAQTSLYKGKVIDKQTNKGISNVHVFSNTNNTNGTITNADGNFAIQLKNAEKLILSHIGYQTTSVEINKIDTEYIVAKMKPKTVSLSEVSISAKKESAEDIIKKAITRLKENHKVEPITYNFYTVLLNFEQHDSTLHLLEEYVGSIYQNRSSNTQYLIDKSRIGAFSQIGTEKIQTHRIIGADKMKIDNIFKYTEDYLHLQRSKNYQYQLVDRILINDRLCYVIKFQTEEKTYYKEGTLYIDMEDYAITRKTLESKDIIFNRIDFTKNNRNGKWYLNSSMDFHPLFNDSSVDLRFTIYSKSPDESIADKSLFKPWSPREFAINYASDFGDDFWKDVSYIPLPNWVLSQISVK